MFDDFVSLISGEKSNKKNKNKGVFDIIPDHYRSIKHQVISGKKGQFTELNSHFCYKENTQNKIFVEKRRVFNLGEINSRNSKNKKVLNSLNKTEENLKKLGILSSDTIDPKIAEKVIHITILTDFSFTCYLCYIFLVARQKSSD